MLSNVCVHAKYAIRGIHFRSGLWVWTGILCAVALLTSGLRHRIEGDYSHRRFECSSLSVGTENVVLRIDEDPTDRRNLTSPAPNRGIPEFRRTASSLSYRAASQAPPQHGERSTQKRQDSPTV